MTRLIDADVLIENHFSPSHRIALSYADKQWMRKIINEAPTVEAIPISWLKEQIELASSNGEDDYASALDWTVMKWQAEVEDGTE